MNKCQCLVLLSSWKVCIFQIPSSPAQRRATLTEVEVLKPNSRNSNGKISGYYDLSCRLSLDQCEAEVSELESRVEKVMKLCSRMVEAGQAYNAANQLFLTGLMDFSAYHRKDRGIMNCLHQFSEGLQEMIHFHMTYGMLFSRFLPQLKDSRREFLRIGEDLEAVVVKNAQVSRHKIVDAEQASHLLLATRKCYQHFGLDYCLQLNNFKSQQKLDILNSIFSYFHAQYTFFHQGYDLLRDLEPTMKTMATQLSQLATDCTAKRKEMENTHLLVQQRDISGELMATGPHNNTVSIEGYLFKRSRKKNKIWKRCWFSIENSKLVYKKSHKEFQSLFDDLRLCAVKSVDNTERRFCFEIVSVQKSCSLQADSEELREAWVTAVQGSIDMAYRQRVESQQLMVSSPPLVPRTPVTPSALGVALQGSGNQHCCDCGAEEPRWASLNLGITMCIECSGIHRSLGVHLSKVRSLTLDSWDPEQLKLLCVLGNDVINTIYEAQVSEKGRLKPSPDSQRALINFTVPAGDGDSQGAQEERERVGRRLYQAAQQGDLVSMATALAQGAEVNWSNAEDEGRTPLIAATCGGSLLACHFLLQNGANVNQRDQRGQGALHAAATRGHTGWVSCSLSVAKDVIFVEDLRGTLCIRRDAVSRLQTTKYF
uniref:Arf-GAP with coiled-coil, ANK repeat and PH domain-containing protein n=1 Tax=Scleropages formosus TaxID=113540 RepID=A0A8C9V5A2_SCLFO